jgi:hypothetical protein
MSVNSTVALRCIFFNQKPPTVQPTVKSHRQVVWRPSGLEQVDRLGTRYLPEYTRASQHRDLRLDFAVTARSRFSASNIAEGQARLPTGEFKQFLGHAPGVASEVEAQILIAGELGYGGHDESQNWLAVTAEVGWILNRLLCSLPTRNSIPG